MKKLFVTIMFLSVCGLTFAAPKKGKSNNIKLDPKKKFAIEGVELGSLEWTQRYASLNDKGEIIWKYDTGGDWLHYGWDLRGTDMSQYAGIKIEFTSKEKQDIRFVVKNPAAVGDWTFLTEVGNTMYVMFNGTGKWYGDMKNPDPAKGYEMYFLVEAKNKYSKTAIKSIELLSKEDYPDADDLKILGVSFGSQLWSAKVIGNEITWQKGATGGDAGWNFAGIDLSKYDRVRIEIESNNAPRLGLRICDANHNNWHGYDNQIEPNVYEVDLSGEGASWLGDNAGPFDKSKGLQIFLQTWVDNNKPLPKDYKTVVKSIKLLKGKRVINENLMIEGVAFGTISRASNVYDGGVIDWGDGKEKYPHTGWNVKGIDFSEYTKIRIVVEEGTSALPLTLSLYQEQNDCGKQFNAVSPTVLEANIDGSECDFEWGNKESWDSSKKIDQIWIRYNNLKKKGEKSIIKSVTLVKAGDEVKQPESLVLNGAKLGSKKDRAWLDENFAINWLNEKNKYYSCGWKLEKLDGDILEIKVTSTDVPLRLRIREYANKNESSWLDDGTHIFRINLKDKKQESNGTWKASEWNKNAKAFDFSQGCEIVLEPVNKVNKDGKKTVVEYIKVE